MGSMAELFGEPISVYTREQAIEDGQLVDVSEWAAEVGFRGSVVFTRALWAVVDIDSKPRGRRGLQSTRGRAHDVLWMAYLRVRGMIARARRANFGATVPVRGGFVLLLTHGRKKKATLEVVADADGVTIGFPGDF